MHSGQSLRLESRVAPQQRGLAEQSLLLDDLVLSDVHERQYHPYDPAAEGEGDADEPLLPRESLPEWFRHANLVGEGESVATELCENYLHSHLDNEDTNGDVIFEEALEDV